MLLFSYPTSSQECFTFQVSVGLGLAPMSFLGKTVNSRKYISLHIKIGQKSLCHCLASKHTNLFKPNKIVKLQGTVTRGHFNQTYFTASPGKATKCKSWERLKKVVEVLYLGAVTNRY